MVLFLERNFLLFAKMNEASWSLWVRRRQSRTCHEEKVRPGVSERVAAFPHLSRDPCDITVTAHTAKTRLSAQRPGVSLLLTTAESLVASEGRLLEKV